MTVYMVHHAPEYAEILARHFEQEYESIRISDTAWFIATEMDMDELDERLADVVDDTELLVIIEISGDFSMQGLPEEQMVWIDEHCEP